MLNLPAPLRLGCLAAALLIGSGWPRPVAAQNSQCRNDITVDDGFKVRSVKVEARGGWVPQIALPISPGDTYDPAKRAPAHNAVRDALRKQREQLDFELDSRGAISVLYVDSCVKVVEESDCSKCVDVTIRPTYLRLDLHEVGSNVLPIPRSNRPTFYERAPRWLLAFNPTFGASYDREYGASQAVGISTNLLSLSETLKGEAPDSRKARLDLDVKGRKSLSDPFYNTSTKLSLARQRTGMFLENISVEGSFDADQQPRGEGKYFRNIARLGFNLKLRPRLGVLNSVALGARYGRANNRFFSKDGIRSELASENTFEARAILEGRLAGGFARLGVWLDGGSPEKFFESYQRLVGVIGYQKEFPVSINQTVGVEVITGGGQSWGALPEYARFYGGNTTSNFLYEEIASPALLALPSGPLIRSFGAGQAAKRDGATIRGGTSFWHLNMNISIPIPAWSRPLIPAEKVLDDEDVTLKDVIKRQVTSAESFMIAALKQRQPDHTDEEARAQAKKIMDEIRPSVFFIADQANIFSVKPLLMFDAAQIKTRDTPDDKLRLAFGGGLQLTVVVAKFEAGYMHTVRRIKGDPQGNFVMRLVFQNLF